MIPLIPTLALALLSFLSSAFVILRIVIPILPPGPFSRHVPPSEFGLPNFRSLTPADKSHIWLATADLVALALFVWQAIAEATGSPQDWAVAQNSASAARMWMALTIRPTCLFVVAALTLIHVRLARPVSFGWKHWTIWAPLVIMIATGTGLATTLAAINKTSLFGGLAIYSIAIATLSTACFASLIATLVVIKRSLARLNEPTEPWPAMRQLEEKRRPSFATEEIDVLRDGSSWITSDAGSRRDSVSAFSFSTHHSVRPGTPTSMRIKRALNASQPSVAAKSSFWFGPSATAGVAGNESSIPPVPPLPSPYSNQPISPTGLAINDDLDPFHREPSPVSPREHGEQRVRMGSNTSWLTSNSAGSEATLSAWSYPTSHQTHAHHEYAEVRANSPLTGTPFATELQPTTTAVSRTNTPGLSSAQVLGGYGYTPDSQAEKGTHALATVPSGDLDVSVYRTFGWLFSIWVPLGLGLPYFFAVSPSGVAPAMTNVLLILSVALSSPILACNILFRAPIPIPSGLFESYSEPPSVVRRPLSPSEASRIEREYKRSGSTTVVEGKRSTDVWLVKGEARDGQGKLGRAFGMLQPKPKLSVMPPQDEEEPITPPLPIQSPTVTEQRRRALGMDVPPTPASAHSMEMGHLSRKESANSCWSAQDASLHHAARVMVAQKHYSTLAKTFILPPSPERRASTDGINLEGATTTGVRLVQVNAAQAHIRTRSASSIVSTSRDRSHSAEVEISGPPSCPLPPTPPSVKNARLAKMRHTHKRTQSSVSLPAPPPPEKDLEAVLNHGNGSPANSSGFSFGAVDDLNEIDALSAKVLPILVPGLRVGENVRITQDWQMTRELRAGPATVHGRPRASDAPTSPGDGGWSSFEAFSSPEVHSTPLRGAKGYMAAKRSGHKGLHHFSLPSLSLGKDGFRLATWPVEEGAEGDEQQFVDVPLSPVKEERPMSLEAPPPGRGTVRSSLYTAVPPSASSEVTLFDLESSQGPQAESTPHGARKPAEEDVPPMPSLPGNRSSNVYISADEHRSSRRSSIVYIKSGDAENAPPAEQTQVQRSASGRIMQWGSRAVRPLRPKAGKGKASKEATSPGLRPLALLGERDQNVTQVKPLSLGRKKKAARGDENENAAEEMLNRSLTSKQRAMLRKEEVLPEVVVRPPSEYTGFGNFRN